MEGWWACGELVVEAPLSDPPHGGERAEGLGSRSSSERVSEAAAAEHLGMPEGAHASPAKPRGWATAEEWLEGDCPLPAFLPPPAPPALLRTIATPQHRAAAAYEARAETTRAIEARTEQGELSLLRAELAEAQAIILDSASARGGSALHEGAGHRAFEERSAGAASTDSNYMRTEAVSYTHLTLPTILLV